MSATPEDLRMMVGEAAQSCMDLYDDDFITQMDCDFGPAVQDMDDLLKKRGVKRPMRRQLVIAWVLAIVDAR